MIRRPLVVEIWHHVVAPARASRDPLSKPLELVTIVLGSLNLFSFQRFSQSHRGGGIRWWAVKNILCPGRG